MENDIKKLFVPYELAKLAKEKGFNEPCLAYQLEHYKEPNVAPHSYSVNNINREFEKCGNPSIGVPLYQQLADWFREKYGIFFDVIPTGTRNNILAYNCRYSNMADSWWSMNHKTYNEALAAALTKAFELIP